MTNDFMNCRISTSFRLFGIPQRKKSAVIRTKTVRCPDGNNGAGRRSSAIGDAGGPCCVSAFICEPIISVANSESFSERFRHSGFDLRTELALAAGPQPEHSSIRTATRRTPTYRQFASWSLSRALETFHRPDQAWQSSLRAAGNRLHIRSEDARVGSGTTSRPERLPREQTLVLRRCR